MRILPPANGQGLHHPPVPLLPLPPLLWRHLAAHLILDHLFTLQKLRNQRRKYLWRKRIPSTQKSSWTTGRSPQRPQPPPPPSPSQADKGTCSINICAYTGFHTAGSLGRDWGCHWRQTGNDQGYWTHINSRCNVCPIKTASFHKQESDGCIQ